MNMFKHKGRLYEGYYTGRDWYEGQIGLWKTHKPNTDIVIRLTYYIR